MLASHLGLSEVASRGRGRRWSAGLGGRRIVPREICVIAKFPVVYSVSFVFFLLDHAHGKHVPWLEQMGHCE